MLRMITSYATRMGYGTWEVQLTHSWVTSETLGSPLSSGRLAAVLQTETPHPHLALNERNEIKWCTHELIARVKNSHSNT